MLNVIMLNDVLTSVVVPYFDVIYQFKVDNSFFCLKKTPILTVFDFTIETSKMKCQIKFTKQLTKFYQATFIVSNSLNFFYEALTLAIMQCLILL
jgi:hypothetical protein